MIYRQRTRVPELGADTGSTTATSSGWSSVLDSIGKVVDIGAGLWSGVKSQDVQVAQLELAKAQAQTAAEATKAQQLIAASQAAQARQSQPTSILTTAAGIGLPVLALGALGVWFFMGRKRR